jgi:hypothetical protein
VLTSIARTDGANEERITFVGNDRLASSIRVDSAGRLNVKTAASVDEAIAGASATIIAPASDASMPESHGYSVASAGAVIVRVPAIDVARAVLRMDLGPFLESAKTKFVIALAKL